MSPSRYRRSSLAVATLAAALVLGACGSGSGSGRAAEGAARTGTDVALGAPGGGSAARRQAIAYARCMRDHGVNLPDPTFDRAGRPEWGTRGPDGAASTGIRTFDAAREVCEHTWPAMEGRYQRSPAQLARMRTALLAFAACMREHGVAFPDPTFDHDGRPVFGPDAGGRTGGHGAAFTTAAGACREAMGGRPQMDPSGG